MRSERLQLPIDIWAFSDPGKTKTPTLRLNSDWGLGVGDNWEIRHSLITGTSEYQLDMVYGNGQTQAVVRLTPDYTGNTVPLETTISQYLSRRGYYDLYVDTTFNRLGDVNRPVFGSMMVATDGQPLPVWFLHSSTNYGATFQRHMELDPADGMLRLRTGSVAEKMTELGGINTADATMSGDFYVDGSATGLPVAENGTLEVRMNPYSADQGSQTYQSFVDRTHRYVRVKNSGTWSPWGLVSVS